MEQKTVLGGGRPWWHVHLICFLRGHRLIVKHICYVAASRARNPRERVFPSSIRAARPFGERGRTRREEEEENLKKSYRREKALDQFTQSTALRLALTRYLGREG